MVARFGGEEFVVLLNDTSLEEATEIAEVIRKSVESKPFSYDSLKLPVRVSIGVACLKPKPNIQNKQLISMADDALYQAKDDGRNCVRVFKK